MLCAGKGAAAHLPDPSQKDKQPFAFFYDDAAPGDAGVVWTCAETASMS